MSAAALPTISVLIPAYNYGNFVGAALESVMAQDYPAELIQVIVVDDGSTDDTATKVEAVAEKHPGRISLTRQRNRGQVATVTTARHQADGDLIAMLDADDVWLPSKTRRHVEQFQQSPEVGLVFNDMQIIDADDAVIAPSLYGPGDPNIDHIYARILRSNVVYNSALTIRADLFTIVPDEIAVHTSWDWWLAVRAAQASELRYIPDHLSLYRSHGRNKMLSATGAKFVALRQRQLGFQLWTFRKFDLSNLTADDLSFAWDGAEWFNRTGAEELGSSFVKFIDISDADCAQAETLWESAANALDRGDVIAEARLSFRALAWNPYEPEGIKRFRDAIRRAKQA